MKLPVIPTLRGALCALIAICSISVAQADETMEAKDKKIPPGQLKKYDANKDGVLDDAEKAVMDADKAKKKSAGETKRLKKYDANKDGNLDESEIAAEKAAKKEMAEKKKAKAAKKKAEKEAATAGTTVPAPAQ